MLELTRNTDDGKVGMFTCYICGRSGYSIDDWHGEQRNAGSKVVRYACVPCTLIMQEQGVEDDPEPDCNACEDNPCGLDDACDVHCVDCSFARIWYYNHLPLEIQKGEN